MTLTAGDGVSDADEQTRWDGTAIHSRNFGSALINVIGLSGGDTLAIQGTFGGYAKTLAVLDLGSATSAMATSISADGIYLVPAAGILTYTKTGTASTPVINLLLKR